MTLYIQSTCRCLIVWSEFDKKQYLFLHLNIVYLWLLLPVKSVSLVTNKKHNYCFWFQIAAEKNQGFPYSFHKGKYINED